MTFRFDPNLAHQVNAIQAVVRLFEGARAQSFSASFELSMLNGVVPNRLDLTDAHRAV